LATWGPRGLAIARRNLWLDFPFILVYATLWLAAARFFGPHTDPILRLPAMTMAAVGLVGAFADVIENACLAAMLYGNHSDAAPRIAKIATLANLTLGGITFLYFLVAAITAAVTD